MPKRSATKGPLAEVRARMREAEKTQAPIGRENVSLDHDDYETLVLLMERKVGKKADVLRQALSAGLKVLQRSTDPEPMYENHDLPADVGPESNGVADETGAHGSVLVAAALGKADVGQPIVTPPSASRERTEEADGEEDIDAR